MTGTLICDEDGLYDPRDFNDRLLLGHERPMSEAELHFIRARLRGGHAVQGPPRRADQCRCPSGWSTTPPGTSCLDPDTAVRGAVDAPVHHVRRHRVGHRGREGVPRRRAWPSPCRHLNGPRKGELDWKPLAPPTPCCGILHNPRYAGAFTYGRTATSPRPAGQLRTSAMPREEWISFIPGAHPGYITLDQYEANSARLAANAAAHGRDRAAGPPREGPALLQGIIICGKCGTPDDRPLPPPPRHGLARLPLPARRHRARARRSASHPRRRPGRPPSASCSSTRLTPLAVEAALTVTAELDSAPTEADALRAAHVERARYHADLARRRYLAVDPANRLVADTLEADWNTALRALNDAQDDLRQGPRPARQHPHPRPERPDRPAGHRPARASGTTRPPRCANASAWPACCSPTSPSSRPASTSPLRPPLRRAAPHHDAAPPADRLGAAHHHR